jgi:tetratricopeptide (TPR) repeat protein
MKQLVLVAALVALPLTAIAGPKEKKEAQTHVANATQAHQQGKFDVALSELEAAFALDPQPDLLYAIAQVHTKLDNCPVAISFYERFLESKPPAEAQTAATEAITLCRTKLASVSAPVDQPPQEQPMVQPTPPPPPPPPAHRFDAIGTTLVGLGVVSTVVGVVMYSTAISKLDDAERARTYFDHEVLVDDAHSKRTLAVVFGVGGVAAIGIGAWHYVRFRNAEQARVAITPSTSGGMVTWSGSF